MHAIMVYITAVVMDWNPITIQQIYIVVIMYGPGSIRVLSLAHKAELCILVYIMRCQGQV